jgi:sugar phosphate permease
MSSYQSASSRPLAAAVGQPGADEVERTYKKVFWRIVPFLMLCYVVAYLDRVNVGFAKQQI